MKTRLIPTAVALLLSVASTQGAAQTTTASAADATDAVVTGSISSVSLQSVLRPQAQDVGKSIQLFAIALVPTAQGDKAYVKTQSGWQAVLSGRPIPALSQALAAEEHPIALTQFDDARGLTGTRVYVGYGLQGAAADSAWQEMIQSGRYRLVYTFPAEETAAAYSLQASTEGSLKTWFADAMGKNSNFAYGTVTDDKITTGIPAPSPVPTPAPSPAPSIGGANLSAGGPIFSGTTLQESGVDEADLVKTDGTYVWSLVAPTTGLSTALQRHSFSSTTPPALTPVDTVKLAFGKGARISGMFLDGTGKQLAVVGETGSISGGIYSAWFSPMSWVSGSTEVALVDTASPTQMAQKRHLQFSATLIGSRRIGSTLYLVLRNYPKIVGFDPYIGYLHSTQYGKPALALDMLEMFRAPVVDSVVLNLLNNRMLSPGDFEETFGAWRMKEEAKRTFLTKFEERLNTPITHPVFKTKVTYRRCLELQMRLLSRWLTGELKQFRGFAVR